EENAYLLRMMKLVGHPNTVLYEFDGYGHDMLLPGWPLLVRFVGDILEMVSLVSGAERQVNSMKLSRYTNRR
ncbi:MAG: hypothetical protein LBL42_04880, partial [Tannerella sp.]|nr:hypothetical protein [Tannerella sp.]